jgi:hypothetical protein
MSRCTLRDISSGQVRRTSRRSGGEIDLRGIFIKAIISAVLGTRMLLAVGAPLGPSITLGVEVEVRETKCRFKSGVSRSDRCKQRRLLSSMVRKARSDEQLQTEANRRVVDDIGQCSPRDLIA